MIEFLRDFFNEVMSNMISAWNVAFRLLFAAAFLVLMGVLLASCRSDGSVSLEGWRKECKPGYITIYNRDGTQQRINKSCQQPGR
jgi:hypothetical protein